jgi:hypothetical protein
LIRSHAKKGEASGSAGCCKVTTSGVKVMIPGGAADDGLAVGQAEGAELRRAQRAGDVYAQQEVRQAGQGRIRDTSGETAARLADYAPGQRRWDPPSRYHHQLAA